ncbi:MAG: Ig-like domain-containing protein, partial [Pirellulaceae bacterium]
DPQQWKLSSPVANSRTPLQVRFNEPLDHAMLHRVLGILDSNGNAVTGTITVDQQETRWSFQPSRPWQPGDYQLVVNSELEDRSGNSIGRRFEIDVFQKVDKQITRRTIQLPFSVAR